MTPSGIEGGRNITGPRLVTDSPMESTVAERPQAMANCNECNEALEAVCAAGQRLALVADNAIVNGDVHRARATLRELLAAYTTDAVRGPQDARFVAD